MSLSRIRVSLQNHWVLKSVHFQLGRILPTEVFLRSVCAHVHSCPQWLSVQVAPLPHQHLVLSDLTAACLVDVWRFDFVLPNYKTGERILIYLLATQVSSFVKCLFMPCPLFYWVAWVLFFVFHIDL